MSLNDEEEEIEILGVIIEFLRLANEDNTKRYWIHPINQIREKENTIIMFMQELRKHEDKFTNFVRMSSQTFDRILDMCKDQLQKQNTNYRTSISPPE